MPGQLVVTEDNFSQWIAGMQKVYQENLAQTYTLHVDGNDYPCNEAVMHAGLPAFRAEQWNEIFSAVGACSEDGLVAKLLQFFYTFEITVCMNTLQSMLKASKLLHLTHLQEACQNYLWPYLQPQNYIGWLTFAKEEGLEAITQQCRDGILQNLDLVTQCQEFQQLGLAEVMELLEDQRDAGQSPDGLFRAALKWIEIHEGQNGERLLDTFDITACSKDTLKIANTEPYRRCLWSTDVQNKLFRASLDSSGKPTHQENTNPTAAQTFKDPTNAPECSLDRDVPIIRKFAQSMHEAFKQFLPEQHADIVVQLSDRDVKAHQVVLVASPYFEAAMRNHQSNSEIQESDLTQLDSDAVSNVIKCMYTGKITVTDDKLLDYMFACDYLCLENLLDKCRQDVSMVEITPNNCVRWLIAQNLLEISELKTRVTKWMSENFEKVCCMESILDLGSDELLEVLNHNDFAEISEKTLYDMLISWISHDQDNRKVHLPQLLGSRAMKQSTVCEDLDMPALLEAAAFNIEERDQVWDVHFKKMAKALKDHHVAVTEDLLKQHSLQIDQLLHVQRRLKDTETEQNRLRGLLNTTEWVRRDEQRQRQSLQNTVQKHNSIFCFLCLAIAILFMMWFIFKLCGVVLAWYYTPSDVEYAHSVNVYDNRGVCDRKLFYF